MKVPCEIIKDLLPLYIDGVCAQESRTAVDAHLEDCESCRACLEKMKAGEGFAAVMQEDMKVAESMKKIKLRINKKIRNIIVCSALAALALVALVILLFGVPVKNIAPEDIRVDVSNYSLADIVKPAAADAENGPGTMISKGEVSQAPAYKLEIPAMPNAEIYISEDMFEAETDVCVVSWSSPYDIRTIEYASGEGKDTVYIKAFKTTILNNKADISRQTVQNLDFRKIDKIVFVTAEGENIELWSK